jgi:(E)-4-hydroxy-3-methylbut-2-enyl-diphosphate synthase
MWKDRLSFAGIRGEAGAALVRRVERLARMGCGILRFAVPDLEAAEILGELAARGSPVPFCADIHFDHKIALRCLDFPIAKLRINPGNIGGPDRVRGVLEKAAGKNIPIRIGVNAGSLPLDLRKRLEKEGSDRAEARALALVEAAERELAIFRRFGFDNVAVSMKAAGIADTVKANRLFAARFGGASMPPLHVGVTEAGPLVAGTVRNAAALLPLLAEGLADTIRVSLSDTPENEVIAGREILNAARDMAGAAGEGAARFGRPGVIIVSCPRCGRYGFDSLGFTGRWKERLYALDRNLTVAVMGCAVNGPEEAKHADLGVTGAGNKVLIFARGRIIRTVEAAGADAAFEEELMKMMERYDGTGTP